ncbi:hypothetical protein VVD49_01965 [Uliginosibacterium sp. H3]|uniref:Imm33-like domain-containing protein n=1 Tax=Uliginosibacterium silvisoli TaxID=3114758 RepID=A0ABU6JXU3_9RHOO|nr:hypothetical protein [Uliginosibacterium sp. H3]
MSIDKPKSVSERVNAKPVAPELGSKLGIAIQTIGALPINGLRLMPTSGTNGWYIWCGGEMSADPEFFASLHIEHVAKHLSQVTPYLDLPPGYRFQIDGGGYEDVWFDGSLLSN